MHGSIDVPLSQNCAAKPELPRLITECPLGLSLRGRTVVSTAKNEPLFLERHAVIISHKMKFHL